MDEREELKRQLIAIIADYREGRTARPTGQHVESWLSQFDPAVQLDILRELTFTLARTYYSRERISAEIRAMFTFRPQDAQFWRTVSMLDIQQGGNSQHEMVQAVSEIVRQTYGFDLIVNGESNTYIYFDDGIFTGKRVEQDVGAWILNEAPEGATLHVAAIYVHAYGRYEASRELDRVVRESGRNLSLRWHHNI